MAITRYRDPFEMDSIFGRRFSDIVDDLFNDAVTVRNNWFTPSIDVSETDKNYEVQVQLPGMNKDDITVNLEDRVLSISGERKFKDEQKEKTYHKVETRYGSFRRSFQLPDNIDPESVNASYQDGVLTITIDKSSEKVEKRIEIS